GGQSEGECGIACTIRGDRPGTQEALPSRPLHSVGKELHVKGGAGHAVQSAGDAGDRPVADACEHREVLQGVGPDVRVAGGVHGNAIITRVDAGAAVGVDSVAADGVAGRLRNRVLVGDRDAATAVVRDDVAGACCRAPYGVVAGVLD